MSEEPKKESGWKKFTTWVSSGVSDVYTKENMSALKMGFNAFLITLISVGGLFVFAWARKITDDLQSIAVMQMWAATSTMLGIMIGVFFGSVKKSTELLSKKTESISNQTGVDMQAMDTSELEEIYKEEEKTQSEPVEQPNVTIDDDEEEDDDFPTENIEVPTVPEIVNE